MPEGGNHFLRAHEAKPFDLPDLVSLRSRKKDLFTRWVSEKITPGFHVILGHFFKVTLHSSSLIEIT